MITIPLVFVVGGIGFLLVRFGKKSLGMMLFGTLFGVVLASTAAGPPIADGLEFLCEQALIGAQDGLEWLGERVS